MQVFVISGKFSLLKAQANAMTVKYLEHDELF